MRHALNLLLASACAAPVCALSLDDLGRDAPRATDAPQHHLRISYGTLPKQADTTTDVEGYASQSGTVDWEQANRFTASYTYQPRADGLVGFGLGVGYVNDRWSVEDGGWETSLSVNGLQVEPQLVIRPTRWLALELGAQLGIGVARLSSTIDGTVGYGVDGVSTWYGAVARPVFLIGSGFEIFAEAGWLSSTASTKGQVIGLDVRVDSTAAGGYGAFGIGAAF